MNKFIIASFMILGFGFYELSGGSDFVPEARPVVEIATAETAPIAVSFSEPLVTRAAVIETPTAAEEAADLAPAEVTAVALDMRAVSGNRVNMRTGPGTDYGVLDTLTRGTQAEVIEIDGSGWARVRVTDTNQVGWMAARLLADI